MSYEPTNWKDGDLVTSAKLNKIEQGIATSGGGGSTFIELNMETQTLNKTWQEIYDLLESGIIYLKIINSNGDLTLLVLPLLAMSVYGDNTYLVFFQNPLNDSHTVFATSSPNGYPKLDEQELH